MAPSLAATMMTPSHTDHSSSFAALASVLAGAEHPVLLLEGSRDVPAAPEDRMAAIASDLVRCFPTLTVRSGNAPGSDQAWARGVNAVAPCRLQLVLPRPGWRKKAIHPENTTVSLADLTAVERETARQLAQENYPRGAIAYGRLPPFKTPYLVRDTVKVVGCGGSPPNLRPATAALFYVNPARKTTGGTVHTMRVCAARRVPYFESETWLQWQ
jgi:hypothetical protein